jgi:hypothetical protein
MAINPCGNSIAINNDPFGQTLLESCDPTVTEGTSQQGFGWLRMM